MVLLSVVLISARIFVCRQLLKEEKRAARKLAKHEVNDSSKETAVHGRNQKAKSGSNQLVILPSPSIRFALPIIRGRYVLCNC